jgi:hypothetical protein
VNNRRHTQLNATLDINHQADTLRDLPAVLAWLHACLNCNTNNAEVTISQVTEWLCWADFLDAPGYGPEDPEYASDLRLLNAVEHWLTLDRKALIRSLIAMHNRLEQGEKLPPADLAHERLVSEYRQAKERLDNMDPAKAEALKAKDPARYNLMLAVAFEIDARPSSTLEPGASGWFVSTPAHADLPDVTIQVNSSHDEAIASAVQLLGLESLFMARFSKN